jgi:hypothetical protein
VPYEQPEKGEKFSPRDHPEWLGKLFLIYPTEFNVVNFRDERTGEERPTDVVTADVAIVDLIDPETGKPKVLKGARIAGKGLVPQIKPKLSRPNTAAAGRLKQLPAQGQKSGAYVLDEFAPADAAQLDAFDATNWRNNVEQPAPPTTGNAYTPPATAATPAPAAAASGPWFANPEGAALLQKLLANGISNAAQLDHASALQIGATLP